MKILRREPSVESRVRLPRARNRFCPQPSTLNLRSPRAFTLLEIMLAIAIFSFVLAAIYSSWILILRATKVGEVATAQVQRRRMAVWTIENALNCVQRFQASIQYYSFNVQNDSENPLLSFTARLPNDFPRNGEFGGLNLRRVTFTVESGPDSEKDLVLRQNPILMDMSKDEAEHPLVLARNVEKFDVECWDSKQNEWSDEWDDTNRVPTMVRFTLVLGGNKNNDRFGDAGPKLSVTRVIAIPSVMVPAMVQGGRMGPGPGLRPPILGAPR